MSNDDWIEASVNRILFQDADVNEEMDMLARRIRRQCNRTTLAIIAATAAVVLVVAALLDAI